MKITKIIFTLSILVITSFHYNLSCQEYQDPQTIGGPNELENFIFNEMIYPEEDMENKVQGKVKVLLTIDKNGNIISSKILESVSDAIDNEALRILEKTMWKPALSMGRPAESSKKITIKFNVRKYKKQCKKRGYSKFYYSGNEADNSNIVYQVKQLDIQPKPDFEDENTSLGEFIGENLKYPEAAYRQNIAGITQLQFIVEPYGKISHINIQNPLGGGCSQEAKRIARLIKWKAGEKDGKLVRSWMELQIKFQLSESGEMDYVPTNSSSAF